MAEIQRRAIFLDRDGVLNRTNVVNGVPYPPKTVADVEIIAGVREACEILREAGFLLIGVTNQPDVVRGTQTMANIDAINTFLSEQLQLDAILTCFHDNADNCDCRKPKPGLILQAAREYNIDLAGSYMIGDRWSDVAAGVAAGVGGTFLINLPYSQSDRCQPGRCVQSLLEAAHLIVIEASSDAR